jgi:hypothetical protein
MRVAYDSFNRSRKCRSVPGARREGLSWGTATAANSGVSVLRLAPSIRRGEGTHERQIARTTTRREARRKTRTPRPRRRIGPRSVNGSWKKAARRTQHDVVSRTQCFRDLGNRSPGARSTTTFSPTSEGSGIWGSAGLLFNHSSRSAISCQGRSPRRFKECPTFVSPVRLPTLTSPSTRAAVNPSTS